MSHIPVYIINILQMLKKCLIVISTKHSITATFEGNGQILYVGELEIHTVLTYHCATYNMLPGPLLIVPYLLITSCCNYTFEGQCLARPFY